MPGDMVLSERQQRRLTRPSLTYTHCHPRPSLTHSLDCKRTPCHCAPPPWHCRCRSALAADFSALAGVLGGTISPVGMAGEQPTGSMIVPFDVIPCTRSRSSVDRLFTGRADLSPADSTIVHSSRPLVTRSLPIASRSNPLAKLAIARNSLPSLDIFNRCADSQHLTVAHNRRSSEFFSKFFCHT
jgi:hypothetical protein